MSDNGNSRERQVNRRSLLVGSTTLAAASVLESTAATQIAQAQQPAPAAAPAAGGRKPSAFFSRSALMRVVSTYRWTSCQEQ